MNTQESVMMRTNGSKRNAVFTYLTAVLITLPLLACGDKPEGEVWKEEVRLMNGELIIADMKNLYGDSGDVSASHGPMTRASIDFDYGGKHYHWSDRGVWPKALQIDPQGRFYIVTNIPYCWAWRERGKPESYYVVFRFEGDVWVEVPVTDVDINTVFNLAGSSQLPGSSKFKPYLKESDGKYKDFHLAPHKKKIVIDHKINC